MNTLESIVNDDMRLGIVNLTNRGDVRIEDLATREALIVNPEFTTSGQRREERRDRKPLGLLPQGNKGMFHLLTHIFGIARAVNIKSIDSKLRMFAAALALHIRRGIEITCEITLGRNGPQGILYSGPLTILDKVSVCAILFQRK